MGRIAYSAEPLIPVIESRRYNELVAHAQRFNFWEFLNTPFFDQVQILAFWFLKRRDVIEERSWKEETLTFREFETDCIYQTIEKHAIAYINAFGQDPAAILVGPDVHHQLFSTPQISYQMMYQYGQGREIHVCGIKVIMVRHLRGFVVLPDLELDGMGPMMVGLPGRRSFR